MATKDTYIRSAQKFLQKGQLDRAIKDYYKALKVDPRDYRIRHKLGELLSRQGTREEAIKELGVVARAYSKNGFYLKAIAVYKQIIKLKSDLYDVHMNLGDLYKQLSLMSEAMEHYQIVADYLETDGTSRECLDIFKRIVELNPEDIHSKLKLAEYHVREGEQDEATKLYYSAASELKEKNRAEELIRVYERLIQLDPTSLETYRALARLYLDTSEPKRALAKLQICFKADSSEPETLGLLGESFLALHQMPKAKSVYKELARVYAYQGYKDKQKEVFERIRRIDPNDPDALEALTGSRIPPRPGKQKPARARSRGHRHVVAPPVEAVRHQVVETSMASGSRVFDDIAVAEAPGGSGQTLKDARSNGKLRTIPKSVEKLMSETEVYLKYNLLEKVNSHLSLVIEKEPSCYVAREKRRELLIQQDRKQEAAEESSQMSMLAAAAGDNLQARLDLERAVGLDNSNLHYRHALASLNKMLTRAPASTETPHGFAATSAAAQVTIEEDDDSIMEKNGSLDNSDLLNEDDLVDDESEMQSIYLTLTGTDLKVDFLDDMDDMAAGPAVSSGSSMPLAESGEAPESHEPAIAIAPPLEPAVVAATKSAVKDDAPASFGLDDFEELVEDGDGELDLVKEIEDELSPGSESAHDGSDGADSRGMELAKAYHQMGLYEEAIREISQCSKEWAESIEAQWLVAQCQFHKGELSEAVRSYQGLLNRTDLSETQELAILFDLGSAYEAQGELRRAIELFDEIISIDEHFRQNEVGAKLKDLTARLSEHPSGKLRSVH